MPQWVDDDDQEIVDFWTEVIDEKFGPSTHYCDQVIEVMIEDGRAEYAEAFEEYIADFD